MARCTNLQRDIHIYSHIILLQCLRTINVLEIVTGWVYTVWSDCMQGWIYREYSCFNLEPVEQTDCSGTSFIWINVVVYKPYTLSYMKPCHEVELKIAQASEGCDVQLEFHEWQGKYMTVPPLGFVLPTHMQSYYYDNCFYMQCIWAQVARWI